MRPAAAALAILLGLCEGGGAVQVGPPAGWRVFAEGHREFGAVVVPQADPLQRAQAMRALVGAVDAFPVVPGARPTRDGMPQGASALSAPYTVEVYRAWRAPTGMLAVRDWLRQAAEGRGWVEVLGGTLLHVQTPLVAEAFNMTFSHGGVGQGPQIAISLQPANGGGVSLLPIFSPPDHGPTLIRYYASTTWTPPRPAASLVPPHGARVDVALWPDAMATAHLSTSIADPTRMASLVEAVNALPLDIPEPHGCLGGGGRAILTFRPDRGRAVTVTVDSACYTATVAGEYRLLDNHHRLWNAVQAAVGVAAGPGA